MKWMARLRVILAIGVVSLISLVLVVLRQAELLPPNGSEEVGRMTFRWTDASRSEAMTDGEQDQREVVVHLWYPADPPDTATQAPYMPDIEHLQNALVTSEALSAETALGLQFVRVHSWTNVAVSDTMPKYPVLLFSPGNSSNSAFYTTILEDLASHGYVVAAIDHPYDAGAVLLSNGEIATFDATRWPPMVPSMNANGVSEVMRFERERIDVRVADAVFVLNQLERLNAEDPIFGGRLDVERVGVFGHSLGGITAARACMIDARFNACANLDGIHASTPFYPSESGAVPEQPFLMVTKETGERTVSDEQLAQWGVTRETYERHQATVRSHVTSLYESVNGGSYQVIIPYAHHDSFTDGPTLRPTFVASQAQEADRILYITRDCLVTFFDHALQKRTDPLFASLTSIYPEIAFLAYKTKS